MEFVGISRRSLANYENDVTVEVGVVGRPNDVIQDVGVVTSLLSFPPLIAVCPEYSF